MKNISLWKFIDEIFDRSEELNLNSHETEITSIGSTSNGKYVIHIKTADGEGEIEINAFE